MDALFDIWLDGAFDLYGLFILKTNNINGKIASFRI